MSQAVGSRHSRRRVATKRDYVEDPMDYSDDEDVPARKRNKAAAPNRRRRDQVVNVRQLSRPQLHRARRHKSNSDIVATSNDETVSLATTRNGPFPMRC